MGMGPNEKGAISGMIRKSVKRFSDKIMPCRALCSHTAPAFCA
jgi:hypothetical protein